LVIGRKTRNPERASDVVYQGYVDFVDYVDYLDYVVGMSYSLKQSYLAYLAKGGQ